MYIYNILYITCSVENDIVILLTIKDLYISSYLVCFKTSILCSNKFLSYLFHLFCRGLILRLRFVNLMQMIEIQLNIFQPLF